IPYWDPTLDSSLDDPRDSIIWTDKFLGNINGIVDCGPFANWSTPAGPLMRNGGFISNLPTTEDINNILSRWRLADITEPNAIGKYNLEFHHNSMHNFIGGHLGQPETSPMDPVFWLIHSYMDLLMNRFNENQKKHNVDPATDYPIKYGLPVYAPD
ncbi:putative tyrosinase-like protein tyr-3, partial [Octopus bimaculoides]|uniref:putative tyrosinase-like protein tyr-3 n=1 Tax=Octopus bimaculoides TaxID=37653 RepID=UPI00071CFF91